MAGSIVAGYENSNSKFFFSGSGLYERPSQLAVSVIRVELFQGRFMTVIAA